MPRFSNDNPLLGIPVPQGEIKAGLTQQPYRSQKEACVWVEGRGGRDNIGYAIHQNKHRRPEWMGRKCRLLLVKPGRHSSSGDDGLIEPAGQQHHDLVRKRNWCAEL